MACLQNHADRASLVIDAAGRHRESLTFGQSLGMMSLSSMYHDSSLSQQCHYASIIRKVVQAVRVVDMLVRLVYGHPAPPSLSLRAGQIATYSKDVCLRSFPMMIDDLASRP